MTVYACPKTYREKKARKRPNRKSKRPQARLMDAADIECSKLVKERAGHRCEAAGTYGITCSSDLEWAHGERRRKAYGVRHAHTNGFCICTAHHVYFTACRLDWRAWRVSIVGERAVCEIELRVRFKVPVDFAAVVAGLRRGQFIQGEREVL